MSLLNNKRIIDSILMIKNVFSVFLVLPAIWQGGLLKKFKQMKRTYKFNFRILLLLSLLITLQTNGQVPVGTWRDHLPYSNGQVIATTNDRIYCATDLALFYYEKNDDAIYKLSKINKLTDIEVGYIAYNKNNNKLIIGYINGNIDVLEGDTKYNFPDIKLKNMTGDKRIYHIQISNGFAYLSTGFGIVVFNLEKNEFADTYIIGPGGSYLKINSTAVYNNHIYALTDNGILKGDLDDPFLGNFENWTKVDSLLNPNENYYTSTVFNNELLVVNKINNTDSCHVNSYDGNKWDTIITHLSRIKSISSEGSALSIVSEWGVGIYDNLFNRIKWHSSYWAQHAIYDKDENLWIADVKKGMVLTNKTHNEKIILPNGPANNNVFNVFNNNGSILVAPGGYVKSGQNMYYHANVYNFSDEQWFNLTDDEDNSEKVEDLRSIVNFASQQNSNHYMAGTWYYGLIEVENDKIINTYNNENTDGILGNVIGGLTYDKYGNLYIVNNYSLTPFVVKTPDNKWYHYSYDPAWEDMVVNSSCKLINTYNNDKWTISSRGKGILVYNDNRTPEYEADDVYKRFDLRDDDNKIIDKQLNDIVQDVEGSIWIASSDGIAVYDYPQYVLNDDRDFYARIPQIVIDGFLQPLLEGENVTAIAVDGANRKWLGTSGGGLFLVSPDGTEQIMIWNTENSKLLSNNISSIDINHNTGEVFIGTDKGMQSYKGTATKYQKDYSNIYAFPNPVEGDYNGIITIRGLMYQTSVKITDISGHLVFETISNGGDAIWNGKDMTGNKVAAGIYLVLCTTPDGSEDETTKILFVK